MSTGDVPRTWTMPGGLTLVCRSDIPRMTGRDALLSSEHAELVRYAVPLLRGADFARYYAVDAAGKVVRSYEEASLSYDGDLMSWAFSVVDGVLWKFSTNAEEPLFGVSTRSFSKRCVLDGLTDAR